MYKNDILQKSKNECNNFPSKLYYKNWVKRTREEDIFASEKREQTIN